MRQRSISQTASTLQSWNENLWTSKFARRIVATHMQKKKKRSRGRKGETLVLFCVCTSFLCRFLCVCRLLCQTSLWRLDCNKEDGEPKTKTRTVGKWLVLSYSDELLSFFFSFFLLFLCLRACPRTPDLFLDQKTKNQTKSMCRFLLDAPASAREFVPYNNDNMLLQWHYDLKKQKQKATFV
jgi:hypothetical protein